MNQGKSNILEKTFFYVKGKEDNIYDPLYDIKPIFEEFVMIKPDSERHKYFGIIKGESLSNAKYLLSVSDKVIRIHKNPIDWIDLNEINPDRLAKIANMIIEHYTNKGYDIIVDK